MSNIDRVKPLEVTSPLLNEQQVIDYFRGGISIRTLKTWRGTGTGPDYVKVGKVVLYKLQALEEYVEEQTRVMAV